MYKCLSLINGTELLKKNNFIEEISLNLKKSVAHSYFYDLNL